MIKMLIEQSIKTSEDGRRYRAQLVADTAAELAGVTGIGGITLDFGSVAMTADGKRCMIGSDGTWHDLSDGGAISPAENTPGGDSE